MIFFWFCLQICRYWFWIFGVQFQLKYQLVPLLLNLLVSGVEFRFMEQFNINQIQIACSHASVLISGWIFWLNLTACVQGNWCENLRKSCLAWTKRLSNDRTASLVKRPGWDDIRTASELAIGGLRATGEEMITVVDHVKTLRLCQTWCSCLWMRAAFRQDGAAVPV